MKGISNRIIDFYSRTNEGFTRAELSRIFPDIGVDSLGSAMYRLSQQEILEREQAKGSKYQAMKYYRAGARVVGSNPVYAKAERYTFVKPAESLI